MAAARIALPDGTALPPLGLGTWRFGEQAAHRRAEVAALREAFEIGYRLIDTAEMYGEGGAETVLGQALAEAWRAGALKREDLFIVSKVYPHNASRDGTVAACERSLKRLGLDHLDLYLLHWRGQHPLAHTVAGMQALQAAGRIRHWGVSNLDTDDMQELFAAGGQACACNQVYYSPSERDVEASLLPWLRERRIPLMAYSPIDQGALGDDDTLAAIGARHGGASAAQVALAWLMAQGGVLPIPKAGSAAHLRENFAAIDLRLTDDDRRAIDARFPPPRRKRPLAMI